MRNKLTFVLLLITFTAVVVLVALRIRNKPLVTDLTVSSEIALGSVDLNSKRNFKIPLTNLTEKDFRIAKVYTSCGCTRMVEGTSFVVKRGETINVSFEFDPSDMHQKGDIINHEVYFLTTNPVEKEYKVKITGKVI